MDDAAKPESTAKPNRTAKPESPVRRPEEPVLPEFRAHDRRGDRQRDRQWRDGQPRQLLTWLGLTALGLGLTWLVVLVGTDLGSQSVPFLGTYRFTFGAGTLLAPAVAAAVLIIAHLGYLERMRFGLVLLASWVGAVAWALALALIDGPAGLTRALESPDGYLTDVPRVGDAPLDFLAGYTADPDGHSVAARGHPPGPVLLVWLLVRAGVDSHLALGVLLTALGALTTPLVLSAVRGVCGEMAARRYAPVLILAPYAVWVAVSVDVVVAVLGAAMTAIGVRATSRRGLRAAGLAVACGVTLGVAALFSYAAAWLGLSAVCLYFARRRPFLNMATGLGALLPVWAANVAGFSWLAGLNVARQDFAERVVPDRPALPWAAISIVVLLLAAGPPLLRSLARLRNTPGWPFLVGSGAAVAFSVGYGLARGGVEASWMPFFPWLTVAAVAPPRQFEEPPPAPLLLVGAGALAAIVIESLVTTPW